VAWEVEFTDEFEDWWNRLAETEQIKIDTAIRMLEEYGPDLSFPMSSRVRGSRHSHMRELRVQVHGKPLRVLYAFDPRRSAILLVGGDKTGDNRWYEVHVPKADKLYDQHLKELGKQSKKEGSQHG
jgi:hypothetical protein